MKSLVIAFVLVTTSFAMADDYACSLTIKGQTASSVAPYKEYQAQAENQGFKCLGDIMSGIATTVLFSPVEIDGNASVRVQSNKGFATARLPEMNATCTCGVQ